MTPKQRAEVAKYTACYELPKYRMKDDRARQALGALSDLPWRGSYLDVSCGRGEALAHARAIGFAEVQGTEVVEKLLGPSVRYALAWDLPFPDKSFEVVSLFDVIEHLLPGDDERTCRELARVAGRAILLTASNRESSHNGVELHVNRRPYEEWDGLFRQWFEGAEVTWLHKRASKRSEMWRITFP